MSRFGRRFSRDERDDAFRMGAYLPVGTPVQNKRNWKDNYWLGNQGRQPSCVGFAWTHWLETGPVLHPDSPSPAYDPRELYTHAQEVDEWPGENYAGTSVRAGAKVLKAAGFISDYLWATSIEEIIYAICTVGPVVVGTQWRAGMEKPNKQGLIRAKGAVLGGHAYLLSGVNRKRKRFRIRNSWGEKWGRGGRAFISFGDFRRLLAANGEACLAREISN